MQVCIKWASHVWSRKRIHCTRSIAHGEKTPNVLPSVFPFLSGVPLRLPHCMASFFLILFHTSTLTAIPGTTDIPPFEFTSTVPKRRLPAAPPLRPCPLHATPRCFHLLACLIPSVLSQSIVLALVSLFLTLLSLSLPLPSTFGCFPHHLLALGTSPFN